MWGIKRFPINGIQKRGVHLFHQLATIRALDNFDQPIISIPLVGDDLVTEAILFEKSVKGLAEWDIISGVGKLGVAGDASLAINHELEAFDLILEFIETLFEPNILEIDGNFRL
jgi:hypothetical protein